MFDVVLDFSDNNSLYSLFKTVQSDLTQLKQYMLMQIDKSNQILAAIQPSMSKQQASVAYQKYVTTIGESIIHTNLKELSEFKNTCNVYNELVQSSTQSNEDRFQTIESTNNWIQMKEQDVPTVNELKLGELCP